MYLIKQGSEIQGAKTEEIKLIGWDHLPQYMDFLTLVTII